MSGTERSDITDENGYETLVNILQKSPSRQWANKYLDWMKKPLDANDIRPSDESFATTLSTGQYEGVILEGNARCIKIMPNDKSVDVLMPRQNSDLEEITLNDPTNDRSYGVNTTELPNGKYYWLNAPLNGFILAEYEDEWLEACKVELTGPSSNRPGHQPVVFRAINNDADRRQVLDEAF